MRLVLVIALAACDANQTTPDWSRMIDQPATRAYGRFAPSPTPRGVIAIDHDETAPPVTRAMLERGREQFAVVCATCHGPAGDGKSPVADAMQRRKPPSFYEPRIIALSPRDMYRVVTEGYGLMPSLRDLVPPKDRWAVVAYVRTMELAR